MRIILKILAVIGGLFSISLVIAGCAFVADGVMGFPGGDPRWQRIPVYVPLVMMAMAAGFAVLGFVLATRVYRHLRQPDRDTANDVFGIITFMVATSIMSRLRKSPPIALPNGQTEAIIELGVFLAVIIGAYLIYRLVLKRLAARAFPSSAPESHP